MAELQALSGKELLKHFLLLAPYLPKIMGMEDNIVIWTTDKENYTFILAPKNNEWLNFNIKVGDKIKSGVGPVVLSTKKPYHAAIPRDVFGVPLRASAYPLLEGDDIIGVIGITFGMEQFESITQMASLLSSMCMQYKYR